MASVMKKVRTVGDSNAQGMMNGEMDMENEATTNMYLPLQQVKVHFCCYGHMNS